MNEIQNVVKPIVLVAYKNQFGIETIVPINENAHTFAAISGTKTLRKPDIERIRQLGFDVQLKQEVRTI